MSVAESPSVGVFLQELVSAWRRVTLYPEGHPARRGAADRAFERLLPLLVATGELTLKVVRDALLIEADRVVSPPAQRLAEFLYGARVAAVRFRQGVSAEDLAAFLLDLRPDRDLAATWGPEAAASGSRGIDVLPVDYSAVAATETLEAVEVAETPDQLAERLVEAALAGRPLSPSLAPLAAPLANAPSPGLARLLALLDRMERSSAGGTAAEELALPDAMARLAAAVAEHLDAPPDGPARSVAAQQLADLLAGLPEPLQPALFEAIAAALPALAAREAAELMRASLAAAQLMSTLRKLHEQRARLSPQALRLLAELAAPSASAAAPPPHAAVLTRQLRAFLGDEDLDRFPPEPAVDPMTRQPLPADGALRDAPPPELAEDAASLEELAQLGRLAATLIELIRNPPPGELPVGAIVERCESCFGGLLSHGELARSTELAADLNTLVASGAPAAAACLESLATRSFPAVVRRHRGLVSPATMPALAHLVELLGATAIPSLIQALAEEENRSARRHLLDLLEGLAEAVVPDAMTLLDDPRWYVVRNCAVLLRGAGAREAVPRLRLLVRHPDHRVRIAGLHAVFALDPACPEDLVAAGLGDGDPRVATAAATLLGRYAVSAARAPLAAVLAGWDLFGRRTALRELALRGLARLGDAEVPRPVAAFLRGRAPRVKPAERRAAWAALELYPEGVREPWIERGLRHRDPQVREICERLAVLGDTGPPVAAGVAPIEGGGPERARAIEGDDR